MIGLMTVRRHRAAMSAAARAAEMRQLAARISARIAGGDEARRRVADLLTGRASEIRRGYPLPPYLTVVESARARNAVAIELEDLARMICPPTTQPSSRPGGPS